MLWFRSWSRSYCQGHCDGLCRLLFALLPGLLFLFCNVGLLALLDLFRSQPEQLLLLPLLDLKLQPALAGSLHDHLLCHAHRFLVISGLIIPSGSATLSLVLREHGNAITRTLPQHGYGTLFVRPIVDIQIHILYDEPHPDLRNQYPLDEVVRRERVYQTGVHGGGGEHIIESLIYYPRAHLAITTQTEG